MVFFFFLINNLVSRISNNTKLSYAFFDYITKVTNTKQALITLCLVVSKILIMSPNKLDIKLCMFFLHIPLIDSLFIILNVINKYLYILEILL